jgi:two-component system, OmpR family, phosphate regulon sensor histidine kinase PhoR
VVKQADASQESAKRGGTVEAGMEAERGRVLVEESREIVVVLDADQHVIGASRRAREALEGLEEGSRLPDGLLERNRSTTPLAVPYEVDGRRETLLYLGTPGDATAYEELRAGFTAAVSHELRTPLARLLTLLESADLPGSDPHGLIEQARSEVMLIDELIAEVLFLSELETGHEVVALGSTQVEPVVREVVERLAERALRADVSVRTELEPGIELPLRPRMLRVVIENLLENALRYAGPRSTFTLSVRRDGDEIVLTVADDGAGLRTEDVPRLFERFFRADRARASRGTGLGLAIVKHIVTSAGGAVGAEGGPGRGLRVRCAFPG